MNLLRNLEPYNKAIVAIIVPIFVGLLLKLMMLVGVPFTTDMQNAVVVIVTGVLVWAIPNIEK